MRPVELERSAYEADDVSMDTSAAGVCHVGLQSMATQDDCTHHQTFRLIAKKSIHGLLHCWTLMFQQRTALLASG